MSIKNEILNLARRRHYFVNTRIMFKDKVHVELSKRWIDYRTGNNSNSDLFSQKGREYLRSLKISAVTDCLDTIGFLDTKIQEMDNQLKTLASNDKYAKHLITIPGISYYAALLISSEIADINRFPDYEHLSSYAKLTTHQSGETQYSISFRCIAYNIHRLTNIVVIFRGFQAIASNCYGSGWIQVEPTGVGNLILIKFPTVFRKVGAPGSIMVFGSDLPSLG